MPWIDESWTIVGIEELAVQENPPAIGGVACAMTARFSDGRRARLSLTTPALEILLDALIRNSPRTPGTPGRN